MASEAKNNESSPATTPVDSEIIDDVVSDEEYSRIVHTPSADRATTRQKARFSSTPRRSAFEQTCQPAETPSQQTQHVTPLTAAQLRALMGEEEDEEVAEGTADLETSTHPSSFPDPYLPIDPLDEARGTSGPSAQIERHDETSEQIMSSSDNEEAQLRYESTSHQNNQSATARQQKWRSTSRALEVIEETPMKHFSLPSPPSHYIYLLVKWTGDPNWWPARCEAIDWANRNPKATVLFRADEIGTVDLRTKAVEFDLVTGDAVHVYGENYKCDVVSCKYNPVASQAITTNSGADRVIVRRNITELEVDVSDIYLTYRDMAIWKRHHLQDDELHTVDLTKSPWTPVSGSTSNNNKWRAIRRAATNGPDTVSPRKRQIRARAPTRIVHSSPVNALGENLFIEDEDANVDADKYEDKFDARSMTSPRRARLLVPRAVPEAANRNLFSGCIFTVSLQESGESSKRKVEEMLKNHAGTVLEDGLSELISLTDTSDRQGGMPDLDCKFNEDHAFAAVLSEHPRRTLKYLEMLALGWPCLSAGFVKDCIEHNKFLDWRQYVLPAGQSNVVGKTMLVNADISAFHSRWLRGASLLTQLEKRRVVLRSTVPICVTNKVDSSNSKLMLLAALSAPRYKIWLYSNKDVPPGSIALTLKPEVAPNKEKEVERTDPSVLHDLQYHAAAESTVYRGTEWLIQCIINGGLI